MESTSLLSDDTDDESDLESLERDLKSLNGNAKGRVMDVEESGEAGSVDGEEPSPQAGSTGNEAVKVLEGRTEDTEIYLQGESSEDSSEDFPYTTGDKRKLDFIMQLRACRWFTRGWTLQELIAPSEIIFYSKDWKYLGRKSRLLLLISKITGVDHFVLAGADVSLINVARKMSWAAKRSTTRVEDMAYCLMGLFSVNMPLIYGEGKKAFLRLQEEIIRTTDDQSIFAWKIPKPRRAKRNLFYGLLADSPAAFLHTGSQIAPFPNQAIGRRPTSVTSQGIQADVLLSWGGQSVEIGDLLVGESGTSFYKAALDCQCGKTPDTWPVIKLWPMYSPANALPTHFSRVLPWDLETRTLTRQDLASRFSQGPNAGSGIILSAASLGESSCCPSNLPIVGSIADVVFSQVGSPGSEMEAPLHYSFPAHPRRFYCAGGFLGSICRRRNSYFRRLSPPKMVPRPADAKAELSLQIRKHA
jgi:hypothetical protein